MSSALLRALIYAAIAGAAVYVVVKFRLDELEPDVEDTARKFVAIALGLLALATLWFLGVALVHFLRWRKARRWERMLDDPQRAALVPPTEAHVDVVPEQPGGIKALARLVGMSLLVAGLVTYAVLALLDVVSFPTSGNTEEPNPFAVLVVAALAAGGAAGAWRSFDKWRIGRAVERLSEGLGPADHLHDADISPRRAGAIPPLDVIILTTGPARGNLRRITVDANSFGDPPPSILYLRLFDNEQGTARFLAGPWREYGYVHLLRSATSVSADELEAASADDLFITSEAELERVLAEASRDPERRPDAHVVAARLLGWIGRRRDAGDGEYPVYPARQLMCHGGFWKRAVDLLLARVDVVVLDLSGYHREHAGTGYELQRVIDRFPIGRAVMLASGASDERFLRAQVLAAWSQMAAGSPNEGNTHRSVLIDCSDHAADRALLGRIRARVVQASAAGGT